MTVLDFGAGRGQLSEDLNQFRRNFTDLRGRAAEVIGVDVDPVVLSNPTVNRAMVYDGKTLPLPDQSIDLIVSHWVLEHLDQPVTFAQEVGRILRPGGWLCAVTPNLFALSSLATLMTPNRLHASVLRAAQPGRKAEDVFPARFRINTLATINRLFPKQAWLNCSYTWSSEPAYHFHNRFIFGLLLAYQAIKRPLLGGETLMVFVRKN